MQSGKKSSSAFLFILIISTLPFVTNTAEITWSPETPLTTNPAFDWNPCSGQILQAANRTIWIVWASNRTGNYDIFYKISSDGGATWSNDMQLTTYQYGDDYPSIMQTANGSIWVVWAREIRTPVCHWDLYYKTSSNGGAAWSNEKPLTTDPNFDFRPSITQTADGTIWVVWHSDRIWVWDPEENKSIPQDDIFYKTSSDGGATWSNDKRLTTDPKDDGTPSITQTNDGKIWVTWSSDRYDGRDIFYKTSSDGGTTWSNEFRLTEHIGNDWTPTIIQITNGTIWVVWHSTREGNYDIYYKTSDDGGGSWSNDLRLTTHSNVDVTPSITQTADGEIWIVWASNRAGNYDIWYINTIKVIHDVALTFIAPNSTAVFLGETVSIEVAITNEGNKPETFNITVYADKDCVIIGDEITIGTKTATNLAPSSSATLTFNWKTKGVSQGDYTISAYAWPVQDETDLMDNSLTNGAVRIRKLLGDLDYDGDVDDDDYMLFLGSYGLSIGNPGYNPDADFDGDGHVDHDDYMLFLGYYNSSPDLDGDGDVDAVDFILFIGSYGCSVGDPGYDSNADLDRDGDVDHDDYVLFLASYR